MATVLPNFVPVRDWQRLESFVIDITVVNPLSLLCFAINLARYLSCSIFEGRLAPWTMNMCLDRQDFLKKFLPQWLHFSGKQDRIASDR